MARLAERAAAAAGRAALDVARQMVEPGGDHGLGLVAIDQRRAERRVRVGPAGEHRQRHAVATLDPRREQAEQLARMRPDQHGADIVRRTPARRQREGRLVEHVRLERARGERAPLVAPKSSSPASGCHSSVRSRCARRLRADARSTTLHRRSSASRRSSFGRPDRTRAGRAGAWRRRTGASTRRIIAHDVAIAAPATPNSGISTTHRTRLTANAAA